MTQPTAEYWTAVLSFVRAARAGSFTGAARQLGVTPSAVSRAVGRLETRMRTVLLLRSTRALVLTVEGARFLSRVEPVIDALADAEAEAADGGPASGTVRVAASVDLGRVLVARWAADLAQLHGSIVLELLVADRLIDLRREGIDLSVRIGPSIRSDRRYERVAEMGYAIVAAPAYLQRAGEPAAAHDLLQHACLQYLTNEGEPLAWEVDGAALRTAGPFATDDAGALLTAAMAGVGIAFMLRFAVSSALADGRLVELLPESRKPTLPVGIASAYADHVPVRVEVVRVLLRSLLVDAAA